MNLRRIPHGFWWGACDVVVGQNVFDEAMRFLKPTLKTQPTPLDESLITRVAVASDRGAKS